MLIISHFFCITVMFKFLYFNNVNAIFKIDCVFLFFLTLVGLLEYKCNHNVWVKTQKMHYKIAQEKILRNSHVQLVQSQLNSYLFLLPVQRQENNYYGFESAKCQQNDYQLFYLFTVSGLNKITIIQCQTLTLIQFQILNLTLNLILVQLLWVWWFSSFWFSVCILLNKHTVNFSFLF